MAGSRPGTLQALSRLILTTVLRSCHYSHYTDKETEAQSSHLVGKFKRWSDFKSCAQDQ